jgi:ABC-type nitrate/sulfonate/bicarbonate transport system permease component
VTVTVAEAAAEPAGGVKIVSRRRRARQRTLRGLLGVLIFLGIWQLAFEAGWLNPLFFSNPIAMFKALFMLLQPGGELLPHVKESGKELFVGFGIGSVLALVLGVLIGWSTVLDDLTEPLLAALYATPYVAFLPLVIIVMGIGLSSKVFIVAWAVFFPVLINAVAGVKNTPPEFLRVADSFTTGKLRLLRTVLLPSAVPYLLAGMRQAIGRGLVGVIVAEFYLSQQGIGFFIENRTSTYRPDDAFAAILLTALAGIVLVRTVAAMERRVGRRWGISQKG